MFTLNDDGFRSPYHKLPKDDEEGLVSELNPCCPMRQSNEPIIHTKLVTI